MVTAVLCFLQPPQISRDCELSCLSLVEQQPPCLGSQQQPPSLGSQQQPPSLGSQQQLTSLGSQQQPPSLGSHQQPPSLGSQQQPPCQERSVLTEPPADDSIVVFPEKQRQKGTEELLWRQELQLRKLHEQVCCP